MNWYSGEAAMGGCSEAQQRLRCGTASHLNDARHGVLVAVTDTRRDFRETCLHKIWEIFCSPAQEYLPMLVFPFLSLCSCYTSAVALGFILLAPHEAVSLCFQKRLRFASPAKRSQHVLVSTPYLFFLRPEIGVSLVNTSQLSPAAHQYRVCSQSLRQQRIS